MEQFNFKGGNAKIRYLKEPPRKKNKVNTDRVLFVALLLFIGAYFGFKLYKNVALVHVDGMVTMDKMEVHFTDDIRILRINLEEGDIIDKGDTLFSYRNQYYENDAANFNMYYSNIERINRELLGLNRSINDKRSERRIITNRLNEARLDLEKIKELVVLSAYSRARYEEQEKFVDGIVDELEQIKNEIRYLGRHISQLEKLKREYRNRSYRTGGGVANIDKLYIAPTDGIIGRINVTDNEVCYKTEDVMTIHQTENIHIQAYFSQSEIEHIKVGTQVKVEFPDKTKHKGIISKYYVSTYALPSEFQKKYEPTERAILVDIVPMDENDLESWKKFYKMSVKVSLGRFF